MSRRRLRVLVVCAAVGAVYAALWLLQSSVP
jgi:hypothetical protein